MSAELNSTLVRMVAAAIALSACVAGVVIHGLLAMGIEMSAVMAGTAVFAVLLHAALDAGRRRRASLVLLAAGGLMALWAWLVSVNTPSLGGYIPSLPIVASVSGRVAPDGALANPNRWTPLPTLVFDTHLGALTLRRLCYAAACDVRLHRSDDPSLADMEADARPVMLVFPQRAGLNLHQDERNGLWVVSQPGGAVRLYRQGDLQPIPFSLAAVARAVTIPRWWLAGCLALLGLAAVALALSRKLRRRLSALTQARDGTVSDTGWLTYALDAPPLRVSLPAGPAILWAGLPQQHTVYRGHAHLSAAAAATGTRQELQRSLMWGLAGCDLLSFGASTLALAPLVAAAAAGFLGL